MRGIPFVFGDDDDADVLALRPGEAPVSIALSPTIATYVIFVHAVADRLPATPYGFGDIGPTQPQDGSELGDLVSTYSLKYSDGSEVEAPILRRFGIQQRHMSCSRSLVRIGIVNSESNFSY